MDDWCLVIHSILALKWWPIPKPETCITKKIYHMAVAKLHRQMIPIYVV
jgi:hypothetical protein